MSEYLYEATFWSTLGFLAGTAFGLGIRTLNGARVRHRK